MTPGHATLADAVRDLVGEFPGGLVENLAAAVQHTPDSHPEALQAAIHAAIPQPHYRALAQQLVATWKLHAPDLGARELAFGLLTASRCGNFYRDTQALTLVWTGPDVERIPPRRTDQALLQLIQSATATLTIVSFVAYKVPHVSAALAAAARRGVAVRLILEDAEASQGKVAFDALTSLGPRSGRAAPSTSGRSRSARRPPVAHTARSMRSAPSPMAVGCSSPART